MKTIPELDQYISEHIQGVFGQVEMAVLKEEIEKLEPGDIYVEIGVDEGRSARVAHEYGDPGVYKLFIDINDPAPRGPWMQSEGMVGIGKREFYIHGDGDLFPEWLMSKVKFVKLIFLDPHHDYESIKSATLAWEPLMLRGSVMLFHDTDHPDTFKWLNDHFGEDNWENINGKVGRVTK